VKPVSAWSLKESINNSVLLSVEVIDANNALLVLEQILSHFTLHLFLVFFTELQKLLLKLLWEHFCGCRVALAVRDGCRIAESCLVPVEAGEHIGPQRPWDEEPGLSLLDLHDNNLHEYPCKAAPEKERVGLEE